MKGYGEYFKEVETIKIYECISGVISGFAHDRFTEEHTFIKTGSAWILKSENEFYVKLYNHNRVYTTTRDNLNKKFELVYEETIEPY